MARKFKINIDNDIYDSINDGEEKTIEVPMESNHLTVKVMNYVSKPIAIKNGESYEISQSLFSLITTYLMIISAVVYAFAKYIAKMDQPIFLYITAPFVLVSLYFSTFGRKKVILTKVKDKL